MIDQATPLRSLAERAAGEFAAHAGPAPRVAVVTAGQVGVGVSTLAVNLAVALARSGRRVALVDADFTRGDVARMCRVPARYSVADVLAARRDLHEVFERGPAGLLVVPGLNALERVAARGESGQQRLLAQIKSLGRRADWVVVDAGEGPSPFTRRLWSAADQVALVTTPAAVAMMEAYATLKVISSGASSSLAAVGLVVNQVEHPNAAPDVFARFQGSCQKFLGCEMELLGAVPRDSRLGESHTAASPLAQAAPANAAARAIERLAATIVARNNARRGAA